MPSPIPTSASSQRLRRAWRVALENARLFDETKRLLSETNERAAELALINDVQHGLAQKLDRQSMYDLVGDRIQAIFDAQIVDIAVVEPEHDQVRFLYTIERGVRFPEETLPIIGPRRHVIGTRQPLVFNRDVLHQVELLGQAPGMTSGEQPLSAVWVPARRRRRGPRDHVPPEHRPRGRLQRLRRRAPDDARREPQRRARERPPDRRDPPAARRAGDGQRGRPGAVEPARPRRRCIELVGEQMRQTFDADICYVALHDAPNATGSCFPYFHEVGGRTERRSRSRSARG